MNPRFWLGFGLLDIDLMLMNSYVVLHGLFIDVLIVVNWWIYIDLTYFIDCSSFDVELLVMALSKGLYRIE